MLATKKLVAVMLGLLLVSGLFTSSVLAEENVIDEKFGLPIVVYGGNLSDEQRQQVRDILKVTDVTTVEEMDVTGEDLVKYIKDGDVKSRMFSSVRITRLDKGNGISVKRLTPENITAVTDSMYANAMLTAGITDAKIEVVSPVKVSGHSALSGLYKAYESQGETLDVDRMEVANEELDVATDLLKVEGVTNDKVNLLLSSIKTEMAEKMPKDRMEVEVLVRAQMDLSGVVLPEEDIQRLVDLFDKMRSININFDDVKSQLDEMSNKIQDKLKDVIGTDTEGFWEGVKEFFTNVFSNIGDFFKGFGKYEVKVEKVEDSKNNIDSTEKTVE